jgi:hypothetical protein
MRDYSARLSLLESLGQGGRMNRSSQLCFALLAAALTLTARARETPAPAAEKGVPPKVVKIKARTNPGDLPYSWVFENQAML